MPKARPERERDEKVSEIVAAAVERLRAGGYDALSVIGIARDLGVAQNTIYWYFPSKDHLFVAALQQIFDDISARKPARGTSVIDRIVWFTEQLNELYDLRAAMDEQARRSEIVAEFVARFHAHLRDMLADALRRYVAPDELDLAVDTFIIAADGLCLQNVKSERGRALLRYTLERLIGSDAHKVGVRTADEGR
ncbi:MAG: hypothetical protein QOC87_668 [Actinomycetota bacterium]|jgi:AcrR family transcriptional regulator|nr:hypothetical protein [Actinomycetota bacterium]